MINIYRENDGDLGELRGVPVGILGYGSLGRSMALNLRDSGLEVLIGTPRPDDSAELAELERFNVSTIEAVVATCPVNMLLLPDEEMPEIYLTRISPHLRAGHTLVFASAYNVVFGFIEPPPFVDVALLAPRIIAPAVRDRFISKQGFYSFVAVGQDATKRVWPTLLALAKASGTLRLGAVEITMEHEAHLDLFVQQAILPAILQILTTGASVLLERGFPPEAAMLDLYISGELNEYLERAAANGLLHALDGVTKTAQFGIFSRLERFRELKMERLMEQTLDEIIKGRFAQDWGRDITAGMARLHKFRNNIERAELADIWEMEQQAIDIFRRG